MDSTAQIVLAIAALVTAFALLLRSHNTTLERMRDRITELEKALKDCETNHDKALALIASMRSEIKDLRNEISGRRAVSLLEAAGAAPDDVIEEPARRARGDER